MRIRIMVVLLVSCLLVNWTLSSNAQNDGKKPTEKVDAEEIQKLIQKLGSPRFAVRNLAVRELEALGPAALEALRQASKSKDPEISSRAARIVATLEEKLLTSTLLIAKQVRLNVKNMPVPDAVAELAKQSGYRLEIAGDNAALLGRKVTLDTGETTFWEALQQLKQKAGLVEHIVAPPAVDEIARFGGFGGRFGKKAKKSFQMIANNTDVPATIHLADGKTPELPFTLAGSVRVRLLPPGPDAPAVVPGEVQFILEVAGEPRLHQFGVVGRPLVQKAIDDQGQNLQELTAEIKVANAPNGNDGGVVNFNGRVIAMNQGPEAAKAQHNVPIRLKLGDKAAKRLTELSGLVTVQILKDGEPRITVNNILKAEGQSLKAKDGTVFQVQSVEKTADDAIKIQYALEDPAEQNPMGFGGANVRIFINGRRINSVPTGQPNYPKLLDDQGRAYAPEMVSQPRFDLNANQLLHQVTYRIKGEPTQLILYRQQFVTFSVPFTLKNIPLP